MSKKDYLTDSDFARAIQQITSGGNLLDRNPIKDFFARGGGNRTAHALNLFLGGLQTYDKKIDITKENLFAEAKDFFQNNLSELKDEWTTARPDREELKKADRMGEDIYLNSIVANKINASSEFINNGFIYEQRFNTNPNGTAKYSTEDIAKMDELFNTTKEVEKDRLAILRENKVNTAANFTEYSAKSRDAYTAAVDVIENDPNLKGILKSAWNRLFRSERDPKGNLVSTVPAQVELQKYADDKRAEMISQNQETDKARVKLQDFYKGLLKEDISEIKSNPVFASQAPHSSQELTSAYAAFSKVLSDKELQKSELNIKVRTIDGQFNEINEVPKFNPEEGNFTEEKFFGFFKEDTDNKLQVLNLDTGQLEPMPFSKFYEYSAPLYATIVKQKVAANELVNPAEIATTIVQMFSDEGRFVKLNELKINPKFAGLWRETVWDADDILFIPPSSTANKNTILSDEINVTDAVNLHQNLSSPQDTTVLDEGDDETVPKFSSITFNEYLNSDDFKNLSNDNQINEISNMIETYPNETKTILSLYRQSEKDNTKSLIVEGNIDAIEKNVNVKKSISEMSENELDTYVDEKSSEITEDFFRGLVRKSDFKTLQKYADGERVFDTVRLKALLKRYNLSPNASTEEVEIFLQNFDEESFRKSLLERQ